MGATSNEVIRVGIIGVGRGMSFAHGCKHVGMELVALCDIWEERLLAAGEQLGVATYTDYDEFLGHDMDAVILANYFHQHAPFAIKALDRGFHVMSETMACKTMGEGVALCEAVERSGRIYMFAENYPFSVANQELRRLYQAGEIGEVRYAEGEYNHPGEEQWRLSISPGFNHWRNWLPPTYYCSHALAPLMCITDTMPVTVNGLAIVEEPTQSPNTVKMADAGDVMLVRMDNGAVFRLWGLTMSSISRVRYELHGERGLIATAEPNHWAHVRIFHEPWLLREGQQHEVTYAPDWPAHGDLAEAAGHGGGDFWTNFHFANAIRDGQQPYLDVYRGTAMAAVGIQGWRSCLQEGQPMPIPDFRDPTARAAYRDDHWSPFPEDAGPGQPPPSLRGIIPPAPEVAERARQYWASLGYHE